MSITLTAPSGAKPSVSLLLRNLTPSHGLVNTVDIVLLHIILGELLRKQSRFNLSNNHLIRGTDLLRSSKESTPIVDYLKPLTRHNKLEVISFVLQNVSVNYVLMGQLDNALKTVNECLDMKIKCFGMQKTECAYSLIQKGAIYGLKDKFGNAKTFMTQCIFLLKQKLPKSHSVLAAAMANYSLVLKSIATTEEAEQVIELAIDSLSQTLTTENLECLIQLFNRCLFTDEISEASKAAEVILHKFQKEFQEIRNQFKDEALTKIYK